MVQLAALLDEVSKQKQWHTSSKPAPQLSKGLSSGRLKQSGTTEAQNDISVTHRQSKIIRNATGQ